MSNDTNLIPTIKPLFCVDLLDHCNFRCIDACRQGFRFRHYNEEEDLWGPWFDDFEYHHYRDSDGLEHRLPCHSHIGETYSYVHCYIEIPQEWTLIDIEPSNSDQIKKEIGNLQIDLNQRTKQ